MLRIMLQKLWHKKWMVMCLLLGSILLIATVVSFPLYRTAAFDRMLQDVFVEYMSETGEWPTMIEMVFTSKKDHGGKAMKMVEGIVGEMNQNMGVTGKEDVMFYMLAPVDAHSLMNRTDSTTTNARIGMASNLPAHAKIISGEMYSDTGMDETGAYEVVISQACMVNANLLVGETIEFDGLKNADNENIRIKVVGVYQEAEIGDFYWQTTPDEFDNVCFMNENLFRECFTGDRAAKYTITCNYFHMFEYEDIKASGVEKINTYTKFLKEESSVKATMKNPPYRDLLEQYDAKKTRIEATLFILQIPVLILLAAFLFMISGQMYDMERNEISVLKSRGSSSGQIFRLYLYQSVFLAMIGTAAGIPLGTVFCRILGSAKNFLEFDLGRNLMITFNDDVWKYTAIAAGACVLIMTLPALKHSRLTIVKLKQSKALRKSSLWEKLFLDVICLGIALYGYYNFSKNQEAMVQNVLMGKSLDPLLYISSSLFLVGMGLLFLRIQPWIITLIYTLGKRFWKPANYASFMENIKNGRKQQFIMLFMMLTISLGMFHATVARTILQNAQDNNEYLNGADLIVKERWYSTGDSQNKDNADGSSTWIEPSYSKYNALSFVTAHTKVVFDTKAFIIPKKGVKENITLMAIHTKQFGEITSAPDYLMEKPYYELLNELAVEYKGVLVSRNFETVMGLKVGDSVNFQNSDGVTVDAKIVDFFDYWPGYQPSFTELNPDGTVKTTENYLLVANIGYLQKKAGVTPYEVWMKTNGAVDSKQLYSWVQDNKIHLQKYVDKSVETKKTVEDPLLQGTNGVLTMGFIVTIILCAVGYLIYWIMAIRSREMMFGVLRACGMHKGELFHMLINEQIFSGVFSIFVGIGIGKLGSSMFVPMLQTAYAAANQVLPMRLITNPDDMIRLYIVIAGVMAVCMLVLVMLVFKLNIAKALKLGEE